jgi:transposase-like protein
MAGTKGMTHYSIRTKEETVRLYLEEGMTYREIALRLEIRDAERIRKWVKQYRREGITAFTKPQGRPKKVEDEKAYIARLEMENKLLKKLQSELREGMLAKRDIGRSTIIKKNTR